MDASESLTRAQPLLGTFVEITAVGATRADGEDAIEAAFAAVAQVHRLMSFHDADSDVGRLNREASARAVGVHPWTFQVLDAAVALHRQSGGAFDVTIAPVLQKIGLLPDSADDDASSASDLSRSATIELLSGHRVRFPHPGIRIDLGGIAKGFAVDRAIDVLKAHGLTSGMVNAGGDLAAFGPEPYPVLLRDPGDPRRMLGAVAVANEALASSGGRFDPLRSAEVSPPAIIDPAGRNQVRARSGVTVRAPSCMIADALTKVVMIQGESAAELLSHYRAAALVVDPDQGVRVSSAWRGVEDRAA